MRLSVVAFTAAGADLAVRAARALEKNGHTLLDIRVIKSGVSKELCSLSEWTRTAFDSDGIIFVGACGIAVRAIAPYIRDKMTDPAVVSIDERGRFAVALLSGHVGGANELASQVAAAVGGTPVISTATDLSGLFAVDVWAVKQNLYICERTLAKSVSAALLDRKLVGFRSDFPVAGPLPAGLIKGSAPLGVYVTLDRRQNPFEQTLHLEPRIVTVGVGCRRGVKPDVFERVVLNALSRAGISEDAVCRLATIDLKQDEACIQAFCASRSLPLECVPASDLAAVEGHFTPSSFVKDVTGVDNVCERAAVYASHGRLIAGKWAEDGVTTAIAVSDWTVRFDEAGGCNG